MEELLEAEQQGVVVHIMAHIPPGDAECLEGWARNYYRIVNRFEYTVRAQFFGHVHTDSFTVFYEDMDDAGSRPTNLLFSAPSATTFEGLNPAYRVYLVDGNYEHSTYVSAPNPTRALAGGARLRDLLPEPEPAPRLPQPRLGAALLGQGGRGEGGDEGRLQSEYALPDLTPRSWAALAESVRNNASTYRRFLRWVGV